ncbi:sigma 54-interacting transcriptional regulator [Myxococcota bacterium]|nr:sigma 54-interacting transcriptional regulator [Myxococcota bacterium]
MTPADVAADLVTLREHREESEAGRWLLDRVLEGVVASLGLTSFGAEAKVAGASLHLHDGVGFRLHLGRAAQDGAAPGAEPRADLLASANVWSALKDHAEAVLLDVRTRMLTYRAGRSQPLDGRGQRSETVARLGRQQVTHLLGLPLRAPGRGLVGMITVEVRCRLAVAENLGLFDGAAGAGLDGVQLRVDLTAPALLLLPPSPPPPGREAESAAHHEALRYAEEVARSSVTLAVVGPRGSGRAWLAERVHALSERRAHRLISLEGHRVTPASLALDLRTPGTVLIREVDALSSEAQTALTAWLDDPGPVAARLIVTYTPDRDLTRALRGGLPQRLTAWSVAVVGLHKRVEDIPALTRGLLAAELRRPEEEVIDLLSDEALKVFQAGSYLNNVEDLRVAVIWAYREAERRAPGHPSPRLRAEHARLGLQRLLPTPRAVLDQLRPGARALVERAPELLRAPPPPQGKAPQLLNLAEGFIGLVVAEALAAAPDPRDAAERLGFNHQIEDGNHLKTLRAAEDKLVLLAERLGEPWPRLPALAPRRKT